MSILDLLRNRATDPAERDRVFLRFEDERFTFADVLAESSRYARMFLRHRRDDRPFHLGLLLENRPEFVFAELGAGLAGAAVVGLNPTRRGSHLARDVGFSDCQLVVTEPKYAPLLAEALAAPSAEDPPRLERVWVTTRRNAGAEASGALRPLEGDLAGESGEDPGIEVADTDLFLILFTSGTTQAPKGVMRSHGPLAMMGLGAGLQWVKATPDDVVYTAMPLFHANAQVLGLALSLGAGCGWALARSFHKSRFLPDVRHHGATLFHYVGNPLSYVLDTAARPDDADCPLRFAFGNEAPRHRVTEFARRFGCEVSDGYGASEVGVTFLREESDPPASLGRAMSGVAILDENDRECAVAELDAEGRLRNPEAAVGEIVNTAGQGMFEGYYRNPAATSERTRHGRYYSGDLGYKDADGYVYFAGRSAEWLRVQGENFLASPIETILCRHPDVALAAVYGVPDPEAGDLVMAALVARDGRAIAIDDLVRFLDEQADLSPKWRPTFVRLASDLERTETNKVLKRSLRRDGFLLDRVRDPLFWRERGEAGFKPFAATDLERLLARFRASGSEARLETA